MESVDGTRLTLMLWGGERNGERMREKWLKKPNYGERRLGLEEDVMVLCQ